MSNSTTSLQGNEILKGHLLDWLKDAHALEGQAITLCESQAERLRHYPELEARLRQHAEESEVQRSRIDDCLSRLGSDSSLVKDTMTKAMANMVALGHTAMADEVVKNGVADYAFEHFEIATYKTLIATADLYGEHEISRILGQNLREEEEMAAWIEQNHPKTLAIYIQRSLEDLQAKR